MKKSFLYIIFLLLFFASYSQKECGPEFFDKYTNQRYGTFIGDFTFVTAENKEEVRKLSSLEFDSIYVLFYDPFCEHCKQEIKNLKKDKGLKKALRENTLLILTIPPDIDFDVWEKEVKRLPKEWMNAYSFENERIIKQLLWKVPELFVLDREKRVKYINMYRENLDEE